MTTVKLLPKGEGGCPYLLLAPMEGVGDRCFRAAMASVGGFDEAVTEFLRVPINAHIASLAKKYDAHELPSIPLAAQLMGMDPDLMAAMAQEIERRGAPRIDLNCGCPSNTVTGKGAGSGLLRDPNLLYRIAKAMVEAVSVPVTVKMRSGYEDTTLFQDNLLAAQESGISYLTVHPRTKADGYGPPAKWELIAQAKALLRIPVVGNGDILNVEDALNMLRVTGCDALMIGRGSVINPFIFWQIRMHFLGKSYATTWDAIHEYLQTFMRSFAPDMTTRIKINKMKQLFGFLFKSSPELLQKRESMLCLSSESLEGFVAQALALFKASYDRERAHLRSL